MRALELLRADHRALQALFEQTRGTADFVERRELFEEIRDALEPHLAIEEEVFYPAFSQPAQGEWGEVIGEAVEDHRLIQEMLGELAQVGDREDFSDLLDELVESIEDHFEEEEELFASLLPLLAEIQWEGVAIAMEKYRESALQGAA